MLIKALFLVFIMLTSWSKVFAGGLECNDFNISSKDFDSSTNLIFKSLDKRESLSVNSLGFNIGLIKIQFEDSEKVLSDEKMNKDFGWIFNVFNSESGMIRLSYCDDDEVYMAVSNKRFSLDKLNSVYGEKSLSKRVLNSGHLFKSQKFSKKYFQEKIWPSSSISIFDSLMKDTVLIENYKKQRKEIIDDDKFNLELLKNLLSFSSSNKYRYGFSINNFKIDKFYIVFIDSDKFKLENESKFDFYQKIINQYKCSTKNIILSYGEIEFRRVENKWVITNLDFDPDISMYYCLNKN